MKTKNIASNITTIAKAVVISQISIIPLKSYAESFDLANKNQQQMEFPMSQAQNAHSFSFSSMKGDKLKLADYRGKVVMIVNTASQCGFSNQYAEMQQLYDRYKDKGFVVIGVPSDNFGGQEFDSEEQVKQFTTNKFQVTFPLTTINNVKGSNAHPFYKWAREEAGFLGSPKWNFHKYLIGKDGKLAQWFSTPTSPTSSKVIKHIEKELEKSI